ncbi:MAG: hypothetical protein D6766_04265 [Verrucomicrobia bacterium]|nr:MAG: hypothetical protein D6766_04265 [Verrucomicrobiota bacterium]
MPRRPDIPAQLEATAALLLREPDERVRTLVGEWCGTQPPPLADMRQDFFEVMAIPQAGRFLPPYEHVLRQAKRKDGLWFFPPARHDGGRLVEGYYARLGFDPARLEASPLVVAPHLPGDHIGVMFAFLAHAIRLLATRGGQDSRPQPAEAPDRARLALELSSFRKLHIGPWMELYADLLAARGGPYLAAVADAVRGARALIEGVDIQAEAAGPSPARSPDAATTGG